MATITKDEVKSFVKATLAALDTQYKARFANNASLAVIKGDLNELSNKVDNIDIDTSILRFSSRFFIVINLQIVFCSLDVPNPISLPV